MIKVDSQDAFSLRITRELGSFPEHKLDVCLFVPGELGLSQELISDHTFYHQAIHSKRTYFSEMQLEPLVRSRLIRRISKQQERPNPQYRLSLSLYAMQYVTALEQETDKVLREHPDDLRAVVADLLNLSGKILKRLRRTPPKDDSHSRYYTNIDNYLSWLTEQRFLKLAKELEFADNENDIKELLIRIAKREHRYREEQDYNSSRIREDSVRLSNKMRLLRRLIEYPITLRRVSQELGETEQKFVKAGVAAVVMTTVSFMVLQARDSLSDVTVIFLISVALLYALREFFRDDIRQKLWLWLRKGRPKWKHVFIDSSSEKEVGKSLEWFDLKDFAQLPEEIRKARRASTPQRGERVMHYVMWSRMLPARFLSGYASTRETLVLDLEVLAPLLEQVTFPIYRIEDSEVVREDVEKRYVLNLVTRQRWSDKDEIQRWKVVVNRGGIIEVEESK